MTQLHVAIPDDLGEWVEAQAAEAQLDGVGAYVASLLRREREDAEKLAQLQAAIDEGLASPVSERDPFEYLAELRSGLRRSVDAA